jgi:hypothetical protein
MRLAVRSTVVATCLAILALAATASARPFEPIPAVHVSPPVTQSDQTAIPPVLGKTKAAEQAAIERLKAQHYTDPLPVNPAYSGAMYRGYGPRGPATVHKQSPSTRPDSGFDWGDAAIGAAAGLALTLLVVGGGIAVSRRRSVHRSGADLATTA